MIEKAAAELFRATTYANLADGSLTSANVDLDSEYVWVVADPDDRPVGFAIVHFHETTAHLHELDVHPQHSRRGLGRQLIESVTVWARAQGFSAVTLTTFRDIPWNVPYYTRLGFRTLDIGEISQALQKILLKEANDGSPMENRICVQLDL